LKQHDLAGTGAFAELSGSHQNFPAAHAVATMAFCMVQSCVGPLDAKGGDISRIDTRVANANGDTPYLGKHIFLYRRAQALKRDVNSRLTGVVQHNHEFLTPEA